MNELKSLNETQKAILDEKKRENAVLEINFGDLKQEFEILLKKKYELDGENKNLSKKLEKFNENVKFSKETLFSKTKEEIKNLQAQVKSLL